MSSSFHHELRHHDLRHDLHHSGMISTTISATISAMIAATISAMISAMISASLRRRPAARAQSLRGLTDSYGRVLRTTLRTCGKIMVELLRADAPES